MDNENNKDKKFPGNFFTEVSVDDPYSNIEPVKDEEFFENLFHGIFENPEEEINDDALLIFGSRTSCRNSINSIIDNEVQLVKNFKSGELAISFIAHRNLLEQMSSEVFEPKDLTIKENSRHIRNQYKIKHENDGRKDNSFPGKFFNVGSVDGPYSNIKPPNDEEFFEELFQERFENPDEWINDENLFMIGNGTSCRNSKNSIINNEVQLFKILRSEFLLLSLSEQMPSKVFEPVDLKKNELIRHTCNKFKFEHENDGKKDKTNSFCSSNEYGKPSKNPSLNFLSLDFPFRHIPLRFAVTEPFGLPRDEFIRHTSNHFRFISVYSAYFSNGVFYDKKDGLDNKFSSNDDDELPVNQSVSEPSLDSNPIFENIYEEGENKNQSEVGVMDLEPFKSPENEEKKQNSKCKNPTGNSKQTHEKLIKEHSAFTKSIYKKWVNLQKETEGPSRKIKEQTNPKKEKEIKEYSEGMINFMKKVEDLLKLRLVDLFFSNYRDNLFNWNEEINNFKNEENQTKNNLNNLKNHNTPNPTHKNKKTIKDKNTPEDNGMPRNFNRGMIKDYIMLLFYYFSRCSGRLQSECNETSQREITMKDMACLIIYVNSFLIFSNLKGSKKLFEIFEKNWNQAIKTIKLIGNQKPQTKDKTISKISSPESANVTKIQECLKIMLSNFGKAGKNKIDIKKFPIQEINTTSQILAKVLFRPRKKNYYKKNNPIMSEVSIEKTIGFEEKQLITDSALKNHDVNIDSLSEKNDLESEALLSEFKDDEWNKTQSLYNNSMNNDIENENKNLNIYPDFQKYCFKNDCCSDITDLIRLLLSEEHSKYKDDEFRKADAKKIEILEYVGRIMHDFSNIDHIHNLVTIDNILY